MEDEYKFILMEVARQTVIDTLDSIEDKYDDGEVTMDSLPAVIRAAVNETYSTEFEQRVLSSHKRFSEIVEDSKNAVRSNAITALFSIR